MEDLGILVNEELKVVPPSPGCSVIRMLGVCILGQQRLCLCQEQPSFCSCCSLSLTNLLLTGPGSFKSNTPHLRNDFSFPLNVSSKEYWEIANRTEDKQPGLKRTLLLCCCYCFKYPSWYAWLHFFQKDLKITLLAFSLFQQLTI